MKNKPNIEGSNKLSDKLSDKLSKNLAIDIIYTQKRQPPFI